MIKIILIIVLIIIAVPFLGLMGYFLVGEKLMDQAVLKKPGNHEEYSSRYVLRKKDSPLQSKKVIYLGSSVTLGRGSLNESFVEYLLAKDGVIPLVKEAVGGTTLVTRNENDYIPRMKKIDKNLLPDLFICQLSTNDATRKLPLGKISDSKDPNSFDESTIAGAIETVIAYAKETWNCPVLFYTGTRYKNEAYEKMVDLLPELKEKWDIKVIDQWHDEGLNNIDRKTRSLYMLDGIHPTRLGYRDWWLPQFESGIEEALKVKI